MRSALNTNADIVDLQRFYGSPLGQATARAVTLAISPLWKPMSDERLVGLGYALPYLDRFGADAERALAFMPGGQGVQAWPESGRTRACLVGEALPLGDSSVDRLLAIHALEFAESPQTFLSEAWRVLAPGGRLVVIVPHRRGVWARFEHTPFGSGRPWSRTQLIRLLRQEMFAPANVSDALFFPPLRSGSPFGLSAPLERTGRRLWPIFAGVIMVDAVKQLYRGIPVAGKAAHRRRLARPVLIPAGAGAGARTWRHRSTATEETPVGTSPATAPIVRGRERFFSA